jgi:DNA-3-methyladenine glycosylase
MPPVEIARSLLGQRLVRVHEGTRLAGLIIEVEAYLGVPDRAAHTYNGRRTPRNASMWKDGGHAYVYFTYGMHHCFNVVAGQIDDPVAVLVRAVQPVEGIDEMRRFRAQRRSKKRAATALRETGLCSGPAKLCQAMRIDRSLDGIDLVRHDHLWIEQARPRPYPDTEVVAAPRIGVAYAGDWASKPLRFYLKNSPYVSKHH